MQDTRTTPILIVSGLVLAALVAAYLLTEPHEHQGRSADETPAAPPSGTDDPAAQHAPAHPDSSREPLGNAPTSLSNFDGAVLRWNVDGARSELAEFEIMLTRTHPDEIRSATLSAAEGRYAVRSGDPLTPGVWSGQATLGSAIVCGWLDFDTDSQSPTLVVSTESIVRCVEPANYRAFEQVRARATSEETHQASLGVRSSRANSAEELLLPGTFGIARLGGSDSWNVFADTTTGRLITSESIADRAPSARQLVLGQAGRAILNIEVGENHKLAEEDRLEVRMTAGLVEEVARVPSVVTRVAAGESAGLSWTLEGIPSGAWNILLTHTNASSETRRSRAPLDLSSARSARVTLKLSDPDASIGTSGFLIVDDLAARMGLDALWVLPLLTDTGPLSGDPIELRRGADLLEVEGGFEWQSVTIPAGPALFVVEPYGVAFFKTSHEVAEPVVLTMFPRIDASIHVMYENDDRPVDGHIESVNLLGVAPNKQLGAILGRFKARHDLNDGTAIIPVQPDSNLLCSLHGAEGPTRGTTFNVATSLSHNWTIPQLQPLVVDMRRDGAPADLFTLPVDWWRSFSVVYSDGSFESCANAELAFLSEDDLGGRQGTLLLHFPTGSMTELVAVSNETNAVTRSRIAPGAGPSPPEATIELPD